MPSCTTFFTKSLWPTNQRQFILLLKNTEKHWTFWRSMFVSCAKFQSKNSKPIFTNSVGRVLAKYYSENSKPIFTNSVGRVSISKILLIENSKPIFTIVLEEYYYYYCLQWTRKTWTDDDACWWKDFCLCHFVAILFACSYHDVVWEPHPSPSPPPTLCSSFFFLLIMSA